MRTTPIKWQHVSSGVGQHQHVRGVVNGQYQQHGSGDSMEKFFEAMNCSSGWDDIHDRHCLLKGTHVSDFHDTHARVLLLTTDTPSRPPTSWPQGLRGINASRTVAIYMLYCYTTDYYTYRTVARSSVNRWRKTLWCCFSFWGPLPYAAIH